MPFPFVNLLLAMPVPLGTLAASGPFPSMAVLELALVLSDSAESSLTPIGCGRGLRASNGVEGLAVSSASSRRQR